MIIRPAGLWFLGSERWMHEAERERLSGRLRMAKACMRQHIIWREHARTLAKQSKAVKP